jgi:hypothetical protein
MGPVGVVGQIGEESPGLLDREVRDHPVAVHCPQSTQQLDPPAAVSGLS